MTRRVQREWLDELEPADDRAARSRRDLRRLNWWMGSAGILARRLRSAFRGDAPRRLLEFGAGDGWLMLETAKRLAADWQGVHVTLLDRQRVVSPATIENLERLGWKVELLQADAREWLRQAGLPQYDTMIANLFLHHFSNEELAEMFGRCAAHTQVLCAVEPRRSLWALAFSHMLGVIGCNHVTRHDAPISVRAGFSQRELSALWPKEQAWTLQENAAGLFSHLFVAQKRSS